MRLSAVPFPSILAMLSFVAVAWFLVPSSASAQATPLPGLNGCFANVDRCDASGGDLWGGSPEVRVPVTILRTHTPKGFFLSGPHVGRDGYVPTEGATTKCEYGSLDELRESFDNSGLAYLYLTGDELARFWAIAQKLNPVIGDLPPDIKSIVIRVPSDKITAAYYVVTAFGGDTCAWGEANWTPDFWKLLYATWLDANKPAA